MVTMMDPVVDTRRPHRQQTVLYNHTYTQHNCRHNIELCDQNAQKFPVKSLFYLPAIDVPVNSLLALLSVFQADLIFVPGLKKCNGTVDYLYPSRVK
jgi:hypothetical protein